jgi:nitrogen fixation NifU-like protein
MNKTEELLKKSGYSNKAIEYYTKKVNVGEIKNPDAFFAYTGHCGDTMEIYLKIESGVIKDAKFQAMGCAGAFTSGSALCEMIKGKTLGEAEQIDEHDIINHLGKIPSTKVDCACLAKKTLRKAIIQYRKKG